MMIDPKILAVEKDKNGNNITIKSVDKLLSHLPLCSFFLKQQAMLLDNGHSFPMPSIDDSTSSAVYAEEDGEILGHIVFNHLEKKGTLWIILSAIDKKHRGRGIYTILHRYFELIAKEKKCWYISSHIHINNHVRLQSAKEVGLEPMFYYMFKRLE